MNEANSSLNQNYEYSHQTKYLLLTFFLLNIAYV